MTKTTPPATPRCQADTGRRAGRQAHVLFCRPGRPWPRRRLGGQKRPEERAQGGTRDQPPSQARVANFQAGASRLLESRQASKLYRLLRISLLNLKQFFQFSSRKRLLSKGAHLPARPARALPLPRPQPTLRLSLHVFQTRPGPGLSSGERSLQQWLPSQGKSRGWFPAVCPAPR